MKKLFTVTLLLLSSLLLFAQDIKIETAVLTSESPDWGIDKTIINNPPIGGFSGAQASNQTIYVAVNDTISTSNLGLVVFSSTNMGETWSLFPSGIAYRGHISNIKVVRSGLDSIYVFGMMGGMIYSWNILSGNFNQFVPNVYYGFDVVASSTGGLYVYIDSLETSNIIRYGSSNGGTTWFGRGNVTGSGANPKLTMSGTGDTLVLNYYSSPVAGDTATSSVRAFKYRETTTGTLVTAGSTVEVAPVGPVKLEYGSTFNNGELYFFYTSGAAGSRDIMVNKSIDNGGTYGGSFALASDPNIDEYGMAGTHYSGGFDFAFYRDSAQTGPATNQSDGVYYSSVSNGSTSFTSPNRVSDNPPDYSSDYSNAIVRMPYSSDDVGVLWVGDSKLNWDYLTAVVPVELTSFTAAYNAGIVNLSWETATETNNKGFQVQRTNNKQGWTTLGFVEGKGTSTEKNFYSFTDEKLSAGKYSYRLMQMDFDGTVSYSNEVEVDVNKIFTFHLGQNYPNPFNPTTTIKFTVAGTHFTTLKIYDVLGNEVAVLLNEVKQPGEYEAAFNASHLASGVYYYKLTAGDFSETKKLLLLK